MMTAEVTSGRMSMSMTGGKGKAVPQKGDYFCSQADCERNSKNTNAKPFSSAALLKQHYMRLHGEKPFPCKNCGKKFMNQKLQTKHESNCGVKYVCSCNVAYHGKRGLLEHVKRSKHELPEGIKEYIFPKQKIKQVKVRRTAVKNRKMPVPILPNSLNMLKAMIAGRPCGDQKRPRPNSSKTRLIYPKTGTTVNMNVNGLNHGTKATIIKVLPVASTIRMCPVAEKTRTAELDALSVAVQASGIRCSENLSNSVGLLPEKPQSPVNDFKSQMSQTLPNHTVAMDSSCQTEDFFAWLESESAKAGIDCVSGSDSIAGVNISTQTLLNSTAPFVYGLQDDVSSSMTGRPSTAQIETQTDAWASDLFQHGLLDVGTCSDKCQATATDDQAFSVVGSQLIGFNENSNNNVCIVDNQSTQLDEQFYFGHDPIMSSEQTTSIQTQTALSPVNSHVMTQTGVIPELSDASMSASLFDFLTHTETQTENDLLQVSIVATAHTQTAWPDGDALLSEFLNIETQTE